MEVDVVVVWVVVLELKIFSLMKEEIVLNGIDKYENVINGYVVGLVFVKSKKKKVKKKKNFYVVDCNVEVF